MKKTNECKDAVRILKRIKSIFLKDTVKKNIVKEETIKIKEPEIIKKNIIQVPKIYSCSCCDKLILILLCILFTYIIILVFFLSFFMFQIKMVI